MARQQKRRRARASLLTKILVVALLGGIGWQLHTLQGQLESAQEQRDALKAQVETQQQENDALSADIAEGNTQEKMEDMARHELGLVYPNERVFSDISN